MKTLAKRLLVWLYIRGVLTAEQLDAAFERWPWLRSA
jgi:hypothetical protein